MIDYNTLKENSKQKFQMYGGGYFTEYFDYSKEGFENVSTNDISNFNNIGLNEHQMGMCAHLTLATSTMNRTESLLESITTWLRFPFKKIVIVDWSSDIPVEDSLREKGITDNRIKIVRINDQKMYNHSEARNVKMAESEGWTLSIDSDIMLSPKFGRCIVLSKDTKVIYMNNRFTANKSLFGTTIFHKDEFDKVGGCSSSIDGWGSEDHDLFTRMKKNGCTQRDFGPRTIYHIPHDDFSRTYNTRYDDIYVSLAENGHKIYNEEV